MLWQAETCWSFLFDSNHQQNRDPSAVGGSLEVWQLSPSKWDPWASCCRNLKLLRQPAMLRWGHYLLLRWTLQTAGRCSQAICLFLFLTLCQFISWSSLYIFLLRNTFLGFLRLCFLFQKLTEHHHSSDLFPSSYPSFVNHHIDSDF